MYRIYLNTIKLLNLYSMYIYSDNKISIVNNSLLSILSKDDFLHSENISFQIYIIVDLINPQSNNQESIYR